MKIRFFKNFSIAVIIISVLFILILPSISVAEERLIKIGVLAKRGKRHCLEKWTPIAQYLTNKISDRTFTIVPLSHDEINVSVANGDIDFLLTNPIFYLELQSFYGLRRIATLKNRCLGQSLNEYGGVVFCRAERTDIQSLKDLKQKKIIAVNRKSFGGWIAVWKELKDKGIDAHRDFAIFRFAETHDEVVYAVGKGEVDGGSIRTDTLERMAAEGKINLSDFRVLQKEVGEVARFPFKCSTRLYPEWSFAKLKHASDRLTERVSIALLQMLPDSPAAKAARIAGWTIPLNYHPVHQLMKELRIGPYKDFGKVMLQEILKNYWQFISIIAFLFILIIGSTIYIVRLNRNIKASCESLASEVIVRKHAEERLQKAQDVLEKRVTERTFELSEANVCLQKEIEERCRIEELVRALLDALPDVACLIDPDGSLVELNKLTAMRLGKPVEELLGKNVYEFFPADVTKRRLERIDEVIQSKYAIRFEDQRDGKIFDNVLYPIRGADRAVEKIAIFARDITEQKKMEMEHRESEDRFRNLVENSMCGIAIIIDDCIIYQNSEFEKLFGFSKNDTKSFEDKIHSDDIERVKALYRAITSDDRESIDTDFRIYSLEGDGSLNENKLKWVHCRASNVRYRGDRAILVNMTDMTEIKELERLLRIQDKMSSLGRVAAGIAHEIRNPLSTVNVYLRNLECICSERGDLDDETVGQIRNFLGEIQSASDKIESVIRKVMDFARPGAPKFGLVNINECIGKAVSLSAVTLRKMGIEIETILDDMPESYLDGQAIEQLIINMISNAAEAMEEITGDKRIIITTSCERNDMIIAISDTGPGIANGIRDKIFDPFFTTRESGSGIGLSICHRIVGDHEGTLDVCRSPIGGAEFSIKIPIKVG